MDMSATASVMPLMGEQTNLLRVPDFTNERNERSFATSFEEIAESVGKLTNSMSVGQTVKEKTTRLAKEADTATGLMGAQSTYSMTERLDGAAMLTNTATTKNVVGGVPSTPGNVADELVPTVPSATEEKAASQEVQTRTSGINVSDNAAVEDAPMEKKSATTRLDSIERRSVPELVQAFSRSDGEQRGIKIRVPIITAMSASKKAAKKEPTEKDQSVAVQVDSKKYHEISDNGVLQVATSVAKNEITPFVVNVHEIHKPEPDGSSSIAIQGNGVGEVTSKRRQFDPRTDVEKNTLEVSKNEKAGSTTKVGDDLDQIKKDVTMSSKATEDVSPMNKRSEGRTVNEGEMTGVSITHGVTTTSSGSVAAESGAGKIRMDSANVGTATGLKGTDADGPSVADGHRMLEATPTTLEVGIPSGAHGWLKIRAEIAEDGGVNASVSATTSAGQEMLHRELSSLTAYLNEERIGAGTVVLQTMAATGSREFTGGMENNAGREQMQQHENQKGDSRQDATGPSVSGSGEGYFQSQQNGATEIEGITSRNVYGGVSWLSVRA
jgi:hypothetical protein